MDWSHQFIIVLALQLFWCSLQNFIPIPKFRFQDLTYEEFYHRGPQSDTPIILTDIPPSSSPCFGERQNNTDWLLSSLMKYCAGDIRLDEMVKDWEVRGGKRAFMHLDFKVFLDMWMRGAGLGSISDIHGPVHAMEYPVLEMCAQELWKEVRIPPFFSGDASLRAKLRRVPYGENGGYPALSFSETGFLTAGHVDWPNNELWIAMCFGRKTARVVPITAIAKHWGQGARMERFASGKFSLEPRLVLNAHFHKSPDLFNDEFVRSELPGIPIYTGSLHAGEILYMPTSAMHSVRTEEQTLYVISAFVDINGLLAPNPNQLPVKLDSCGQRCLLSNFSTEYGGSPTICRHMPKCERLVEWLLDERVRVPLVDGFGSVPDARLRPRGAAKILDVSAVGANNLHMRTKPWIPPWQR